MDINKRNSIRHIIDTAKELKQKSKQLIENAQDLCDHHKPDNTLDIMTGFGVGVGEEECTLCGLAACYIPEWQKK